MKNKDKRPVADSLAEEQVKHLFTPNPGDRERFEHLFDLFSQSIVDNEKRKERAIILLYIFRAIAEDITLSEAIKRYAWYETPDDTPPTETYYKDVNGRTLLNHIRQGETCTIRLGVRTKNMDIPYKEMSYGCLKVVEDMIHELEK